MTSDEITDHVEVNRRYWEGMAHRWVEAGEAAWASEPRWGIWGIPESELGFLPDRMDGMDAIELGCGTAYVSGWMARRGARVVGVDSSERQLATARRLAGEHGVSLDLVHANAESVPRPDGSFDFAVSEYGAAIWADPYRWVPEAHRLLRPGGRLVALGTHPLMMLCWPLDGSEPVSRRLERDYFGMHVFDWRDAEYDPGGVEFNLTVSEWMSLFASTGFEVDAYLELRAPESADGRVFGVDRDWARRWPSEQVWKVRTRR